ncbi:MAG: asparagine synthase B [Gammaproteobacteria bacterium]|nr:asparagine synthase B [Gammaproteobacteria bacterium]
MCGITFIYHSNKLKNAREIALEMSKIIRHRGPDDSSIISTSSVTMTQERLSIVGVKNGRQPIQSSNGNVLLVANGEIYNHKALRQKYINSYNFKTKSDCEVIIPLFLDYGENIFEKLSGMYAFAIYDEQKDSYLIARDPIGIIPLYYGFDKYGVLYVASEMKALQASCEVIFDFPPGHYIFSKESLQPKKYFKRNWYYYEHVKGNPVDIPDIRYSLEKAIKKQMDCEVSFGVLLSGGLDSSIISAVSQKVRLQQGSEPLHSFSVGIKGSPDLQAAKEVADYIGTIHHEINFNVQEGIDAIRDVIFHLETYDITTIRAATPMYLMARKIKAMGIKMVLSGEGSDEIFGGYLYFHKAPNAKEFHEETVRKIENLHKFDCLRSNKSMAAWGIECRVPFLDKEFIDDAMSIDPQAKLCGGGTIEKRILREAFKDMLPNKIVWRQKEQFSDGVGYSWIEGVKDFMEDKISDLEIKNTHSRFPINTPLTKEGYFYRVIFESNFKSISAALCVPHGKTIACSTPNAISWDRSFKYSMDPSGRSIKNVHVENLIQNKEAV